MKSFPAAFATELAKKTGITPLWLLRLVVDGVTYNLSDTVFSFPPAVGGSLISTLPWISQWGEVRESISGSIGEMLVSDFSCTLLVDQTTTGTTIRDLALNHALEQSPVELYLWLDGLTNATTPQKLFVGYVKDIDVPDETQVHLTIEDESTRLQKYIGTRISSEAYPLCDPDAVGKLIPIVYGSVPKLPALCVDSGWVSSLMTGTNTTQAEITISEAPAYSLVGKTITIDDEQLFITGQSADPVSVGGTVAGNLALASYGVTATVTAGSLMNNGSMPGSNPPNINNGDRLGNGFTGTSTENGALEIWLGFTNQLGIVELNLGTNKTISEVDVFGIQTNIGIAVQPTMSMTSANALKTFKLQYWDGAAWADIRSVVDNTLVWNRFVFPALSTSKIRLYITDGGFGGSVQYAVITEVEVYATPQQISATVGGKVLTCVRGYNATVAVPHTKGSLVIEGKTTPLVYLVADHALDSIGQIMSRVRGINVDITSDCTKYLGTADNQLAAYPGRAAITIPDIARVSNRISIELQGDVSATDPLHSHVASTSAATTYTPLSQSIASSQQTASIDLRGVSTGGKEQTFVGDLYWNFPAASGTILTSTVSATISCPAGSNIYFGGILVYANSAKMVNQVVSHTFSSTSEATAMQSSQIRIRVEIVTVTIYSVQTSYPDPHDAVATCGATRTGTYNTALPNISISKTPSGVKVTNTLTLSGNSVADIAVGDAILVDCTRAITAPADVIGNLLSTYCNDDTMTAVGTFPATYSINGAITEYKKAIEWLDYLTFQTRAFYRKIGGVSRLIVRDVNPAVTGTIPACCLTEEGIKALSYKKAPLSDVINKVKVLYSRDWASSSKQAESYKQAVVSTDPVSIGIYGEQEQPELFMFDFVTSSIMANDLATFYQDFYGDRKWRISFSTFLDNARFEFGDVAELPFANNLVGTLVEAGITPGSLNQIDKMNFVIETAIIPSVDATAITTFLGDQLMTKDREGIIYV